MKIILLLLLAQVCFSLDHPNLRQYSHHTPTARTAERRLTSGGSHSGNNIHLLISAANLNEMIGDVIIKDIGGGDINFNVGQLQYENSLDLGQSVEFVKTTNPHTITIAPEEATGILMNVDNCNATIDNNSVIDIECLLTFVEKEDYTHRHHTQCANDCAELYSYNMFLNLTSTLDTDASTPKTSGFELTILPYSQNCAAKYHVSDNVCVLNSCDRCIAGYICSDFDYSTGGDLNEQCVACVDGEVQPETGKSSCSECLAGTFDNTTETCQECLGGFVQPLAGQTFCNECSSGNHDDGSEECQTCPEGYYQSQWQQTSCNECAIARYSNQTGRKVECDHCPVGRFSTASGNDELIDCSICTAGKYNDQTEQQECVDCGVGKFLSDAAMDAVGHDNSDDCVDCSIGTFAAAVGSVSCQDCSIGLFAAAVGSDSCAVCEDGSDTRAGTIFTTSGATHCVTCSAGKETAPLLNTECAHVDCLNGNSHKCRDSTYGTCGKIGIVNCAGQCVNKHKGSNSENPECPTMYSAFNLYTSDEYGDCAIVNAQQTCVSWRGPLQNGFTLDQVQTLEPQNDTFCTATKGIYQDNTVESALCRPYFSVIVPMYMYPNNWDVNSTEYKAWNTLVNSVTNNPRIEFHIIINPASGSGSSSEPNANWQHYLDLLEPHSNVVLYGYVPTNFGSENIDVTKYINDYQTKWNIPNIFLDEVNGKSSNGSDTFNIYNSYSTVGKTICNFGSHSDQSGTKYTTEWLTLCDIPVIKEDSLSKLTTFTATSAQLSLPRESFAAIFHSAGVGVGEELQQLYAKHVGMVYFTPGDVQGSEYAIFFDESAWNEFISKITTFAPQTAPQTVQLTLGL